jgi:hypothetical protein
VLCSFYLNNSDFLNKHCHAECNPKNESSRAVWHAVPRWTIWALLLLCDSSERLCTEMNNAVQEAHSLTRGWSFSFNRRYQKFSQLQCIYDLWKSRDRAVVTATGYGLDDWGVGVRVPVGSWIFSSPDRPDRLWGPSNLLPNGYRGLFPRG